MPHPVEEGSGAPSFRPLWRLMPYLWPKGRPDLKARVFWSVVFLMLAVAATTHLAAALWLGGGRIRLPTPAGVIALGTVLALVAAYAVSRILLQALAQLRDGVFAKVQYHAMREVAVSTFAHVHTLSLRFHLERKTGGLSRVIERGTKGIDTLLSFALFSIFPTILLLVFYTAILFEKLNVWEIALAAITMVMVLYLVHLRDYALAHSVPPRYEPERHRRQHQGRGQSAQFRDREIFQQRDSRDASLRRFNGEIFPRVYPVANFALGAQYRPGAHHGAGAGRGAGRWPPSASRYGARSVSARSSRPTRS